MAEQFYTILTSIGKAKIANASTLDEKVDFKYMALGDGGGKYYNPTESQTELKNEVYRAQINHVTIDEKNPNWIKISIVIPGNVGGFTIREAGVFDTEGNLLAVGKYPETYKPVVDEGSSKDLTINMILEISNTEVVNLKIDPTVILATQQQVNEVEVRAKDYTNKEVGALAGEGNTKTVKQLDKELDAHKAETMNQLQNMSIYNMLPDSGRFSYVSFKSAHVRSFKPNSFFHPINNSTPWAEAGKFIHHNTTFGGNRGELNQSAIDLLRTINKLNPLSPANRRYGVEFFIASSTMGNGTSEEYKGKYLFTVNGSKNIFGYAGTATLSMYVRAYNGDLLVRALRNIYIYINGEQVPSKEALVTPSDGWVHLTTIHKRVEGYSNGFPLFYANEGTEVQIALPVLCPGIVKPYIHTAPVPSLSTMAGGEFTRITRAYPNTSYEVAQIRNIILSQYDANTNVMRDGEIWLKYK